MKGQFDANSIFTTTFWVSVLGAALVSGLVAIIGHWLSRKNAKLAAEIARSNAILNASLEATKAIAVSRQQWINELRADMSKFVALATQRSRSKAQGYDFTDEQFSELTAIIALITMRMNPTDQDYDQLRSIMAGCAVADNAELTGEQASQFVSVGQRILKREWDVLKGEVRSVAQVELDRS